MEDRIIEYKLKLTREHRDDDLVSGIAVGDHLAIRESDGTFRNGWWIVDHVPTGLRVCYLQTERAARTVAKSIQDVIDWGDPKLVEDPSRVPEDLRRYLERVSGSKRGWPYLGEPTAAPKIRYQITITATVNCDVQGIWPNEDWPDDPTEDDVAELIERQGGPEEIIKSWDGFEFDFEISESKRG